MTVAINRITARSITEALKGDAAPGNEALIRDSAYILAKLLAQNGVLQEIHEAIHNQGVNPAFHVAIRKRHHAEWPNLWRPLAALDSILQDVG
jgi:hypothetical protein